MANPAIKATMIDEFIALATANPGMYSYATAGTGSTAHIAGALLSEWVIREIGEIFKGNVIFGEDTMEIPFTSPAAVKLD